MYNIAIVGATGNVGREIIEILAERKFPIKNLYALASSNSLGKKISFGRQIITVDDLENFNIKEAKIDIAFFCAGSEISKQYASKFTKEGAIIIDKASIFRMDKDIPLIIPEVNAKDLIKYKKKKIICSPNCTVTPLAIALAPLHKKLKIKRVIVSTYQSVSGTGKSAMDELFYQTKQFYEATLTKIEEKNPEENIYPRRIAFNCIPQCDSFLENGYTKEEQKLENELHKILDKKIKITSTCVRVPVFTGHAETVNIEFAKNFKNINEIIKILEKSSGIIVIGDNSKYATQYEIAKTDEVFISRIRRDNSVKNGVNFWLVCDNIRKGAALNGVQIAEELIKKYLK